MSSSEANVLDVDLLRLEWSVRALAQPAEIQKRVYPEFVCVADELALEFEEHYRRLLKTHGPSVLAAHQLEQFERIDRQLQAMSGPERLRFWNNEALEELSEWSVVRTLAKNALRTMGWSQEPPPLDRAIYVGPDA
jgi:hypothetical protein